MKTLEKQDFAKLILDIYSNFVRMYQYDAFYDILKLRQLEINNESAKFHMYFRRTGTDLLFSNSTNINLHPTYLKNNYLVLEVTYTSNNANHNEDKYDVQIVKDDFSYLLFTNII